MKYQKRKTRPKKVHQYRKIEAIRKVIEIIDEYNLDWEDISDKMHRILQKRGF